MTDFYVSKERTSLLPTQHTEEAVGYATKEAPLPNPLPARHPARPSRGEGEDSGASDWHLEL